MIARTNKLRNKVIILWSMSLVAAFLVPKLSAQDPPKARSPEKAYHTSPPVCRSCPDPSFPPEARKAKIETATVLLEVRISEKGLVDEIQVLRDPGAGFGREAVKAVKKWKFKPATDKEGIPLAVKSQIEVVFHWLD